MPVLPRRAVIDETRVGSYHVSSRAVRRGFLLGWDSDTSRDHPHRKRLLQRRLELLATVFAVDCLDVSVLDSSFDLILRNRPDVTAKWTEEEVARRWLTLHRSQVELRAEPTPEAILALVSDEPRIGRIRRRLSSISWFMAYLKEPLSKRFNFEDAVDGHFWAERFGCVKLTTEVVLLACSSYLALHPWMAGEAASPEEAECSSLAARVLDERSGDATRPRSGWLAPLTIEGDGYAGVESGRRPTDEGFLRLTLAEYREVIAGLAERELAERAGKVGPYRLPDSLARLGISAWEWEDALRSTRRRFARSLARVERMRAEGRRQDRR